MLWAGGVMNSNPLPVTGHQLGTTEILQDATLITSDATVSLFRTLNIFGRVGWYGQGSAEDFKASQVFGTFGLAGASTQSPLPSLSQVPTHPGWGLASRLALDVNDILNGRTVSIEGIPRRPDSLPSMFQSMPAIIRASMSVFYNATIPNKNLATEIQRVLGVTAANCFIFGRATNPNLPPPTPMASLKESLDFVQGLLSGIWSGAKDSFQGIDEMIVTFLMHPIDTTSQLLTGFRQMAAQFANNVLNLDGLAIARSTLELVFPHLVQLFDNWDILDSKQRGELIGKTIGELAAQGLLAIGTEGAGNIASAIMSRFPTAMTTLVRATRIVITSIPRNVFYAARATYVTLRVVNTVVNGPAILVGAVEQSLFRAGVRGFRNVAQRAGAQIRNWRERRRGLDPNRPVTQPSRTNASNNSSSDTRHVVGDNCFVSGTPLLTPDGEKNIELFKVGDLVLSRDQNRPYGSIEAKVVEEVFVRVGRVYDLTVSGQTIRTTSEHPFFVSGIGWRCVGELKPGDKLCSHDGRLVTVELVSNTYEVTTVYNLRVADYHTYFVGSNDWGFSVWAHNAEYSINRGPNPADTNYYLFHDNGQPVINPATGLPYSGASEADLIRLLGSGNWRVVLPRNRAPILPNQHGSWQGTPGNSVWRSTAPDVLAAVPGATFVDIRYRNGFPDLTPWQQSINGQLGQVTITLSVNPNVGRGARSRVDLRAADAQMATQLNTHGVNPATGLPWTRQDITRIRTRNGLTWHHSENVNVYAHTDVMQLVPSGINSVSHSGGRSILDNVLGLPYE
jgi:hypothetical protein